MLMAIGTLPTFSTSRSMAETGYIGSGFGFGITVAAGVLGLLVLLIGMAISKPRFLPLPTVATGGLYIASFYGLVAMWLGTSYLLMLTPGLVVIIAGIVLWKRRGWKCEAKGSRSEKEA